MYVYLRKFCSLCFLAIAAVHAAVYSDATHIEEHLPLQATHAPDTDKRHVAPAPTMSAGICAFGLHCLPRASGPRGIFPPEMGPRLVAARDLPLSAPARARERTNWSQRFGWARTTCGPPASEPRWHGLVVSACTPLE